MKLFIKLRNKFFTVMASLALLVLSSFGLFNLCTPQSVEASMINFDNENIISITNGSFTNFSSQNSFPYTLSDFTTSGNSTPGMKTGVISVEEDVYKKNYDKYYGLKEYDNPGDRSSKEDYILMINSGTYSSNYTYTSSEFTLAKNGYYYVTVSAMALNNGSVASVYLTKDGVLYEHCAIENINATAWSNYTFFVATNSYEDVKLKFNMQIGNLDGGAGGCVFFDELHAGQISEDDIIDYITNPNNAGSYKFVNNRTSNAYKQYNFDNNIIEYTRNEKGELQYDNDNNLITNVINEDYFTLDKSGTGNKNFDIQNNTMILNAEDSHISYKGKEELLDANSTYKFSIWAKANELTKGSAFVALDEIIDEEEDYDDPMESEGVDTTPKSSKLTISSTTTNKVTGDYVEYIIYVRTGALSSSKVQLGFGLGSDSENATGNISFKNYLIERIPYSAYSDASTGDTIGKIDISSRLTLNSEEYSNYTFNQMQSESFDGIAYPATPTSWTKASSGAGVQLSGVVNLSDWNKVMAKYDYINTISTPNALISSNNNVLMIYNGANSVQTYSSVSKSLTANKYYKVTTFVNTYISGNSNNGATILAKTGNTILGQATDINTNGTWKKVEFYIHTPNNSVDVTFELALGYGNKSASGYAFFDNILIESADTENDFSNRFGEYTIVTKFENGAEVQNGKVEIDLTNPMLTSTSNNGFNTPVLYFGNNKGETDVNAGIIDLTGELNMINSVSHNKLSNVDWDNKNALAIFSMLNEDVYYEYTSVLSYSFESGKHYKMTFELFTDGIGQTEKEEMYDNGVLAQGVNVKLTNLENAQFSYITSDGKWTRYEIYIGVNSSATSNLVFSMGSDFTGCFGRALLGNIQLSEIEENEFTSATANATTLKVDTVEAENEETTEDGKDKGKNNFNWAYIPTIATFLAIVVAVIGVFMRRNMKFKKRVKTGKAEYDRDITVMQNKYRRLAQEQRAKDVRELTKECEELVAVRSEYEEKYKEALSRLRSARLANRDGSKRYEIVAIEHEVKHISKEVARFGVQVNNYENEIEFMQTEAYLIDLEKRMMREEDLSRNQLRKEAEMSEEQRAEAVAKREAKQKRKEAKAQAKADKVAEKQAKLEKQREQVQIDLQEAKALDEKYMKEQELKQIQIAEAKLAKEKAKAEREIQKLERKREQEEKLAEQSASNEDNSINKEKVETSSEESTTTATQIETTSQDVKNEVVTTAEESEVIETPNEASVTENVEGAQIETSIAQSEIADTQEISNPVQDDTTDNHTDEIKTSSQATGEQSTLLNDAGQTILTHEINDVVENVLVEQVNTTESTNVNEDNTPNK